MPFCRLFFGFKHKSQNVVDISAEHDVGGTEILSQLEVAGLVLIFLSELRLHDACALRKIGALSPVVAVGGARSLTVFLVYVCGDALVNRHVLPGEVVIVLVVRIEIFQFPLVDRNADRGARLVDREREVPVFVRYTFGHGVVVCQSDEQFVPACAVVAVVCLHAGGADGVGTVEDLQVREHGEELGHVQYILVIVEVKHAERLLGRVFDIIVVDIDKLSAGRLVVAGNLQKAFNRLLLVVRKF